MPQLVRWSQSMPLHQLVSLHPGWFLCTGSVGSLVPVGASALVGALAAVKALAPVGASALIGEIP